mmetsp:Transcript_30399/g.83761  ORF Transcript_30399/g.83761 Transcript_30399/m.83761 type:complete len:223 (+) Transcript_30399:122-790(+)
MVLRVRLFLLVLLAVIVPRFLLLMQVLAALAALLRPLLAPVLAHLAARRFLAVPDLLAVARVAQHLAKCLHPRGLGARKVREHRGVVLVLFLAECVKRSLQLLDGLLVVVKVLCHGMSTLARLLRLLLHSLHRCLQLVGILDVLLEVPLAAGRRRRRCSRPLLLQGLRPGGVCQVPCPQRQEQDGPSSRGEREGAAHLNTCKGAERPRRAETEKVTDDERRV